VLFFPFLPLFTVASEGEDKKVSWSSKGKGNSGRQLFF
jgi:hypothetical protein